jgi:hypothetical protein
MATSSIIGKLAAAPDTGAQMPALFIGHGNPMNAIEDTEFSRAWAEVARSLPKPNLQAHWQGDAEGEGAGSDASGRWRYERGGRSRIRSGNSWSSIISCRFRG